MTSKRTYKRGKRTPPLAMTTAMLLTLKYGAAMEQAGAMRATALLKKDRKFWMYHFKARKEAEATLKLLSSLSTQEGSK